MKTILNLITEYSTYEQQSNGIIHHVDDDSLCLRIDIMNELDILQNFEIMDARDACSFDVYQSIIDDCVGDVHQMIFKYIDSFGKFDGILIKYSVMECMSAYTVCILLDKLYELGLSLYYPHPDKNGTYCELK